MICRSCGREIEEDVRFCPNCGQDQSPDAPLRSQVPPQVPPPPPPGERPAWLRGMAFSFGGCVFLVGTFLFVMLFIGVLAVACSLLASGGA